MQALHHRPVRSDDGFTLIEVLVASVLLLIGAFATLALLDTGAKATAVSKQRDVANALTQEMVERAHGGRYTATNNDITDIVVTGGAAVGPADRMRAALDPDADSASTAVAPATNATTPPFTPQSWTLRRKNTTYTVSYRACTASDTVRQVQIQGPYDCNRTAGPNPTGPETATSGNCSIGVIPASQVDPGDPGTLTVRLQLLGALGLNVCVGALSPALSSALCSVLGSSSVLSALTGQLLGTNGVLTGLLGGLGSGATLGLCPTQADQDLTGVRAGIATSTRLAVTVAWTDQSGRVQSVAQTSVIRRPVS